MFFWETNFLLTHLFFRTLREPKRTKMKAVLRKTWGHILVWGVISVIFGIMAFTWPGLTLTTLVYLFAIAVIAEGITLLAGAWQVRGENKNWWVVLLTGVINIVVGIIVIANPGIT